MSQPNDLVNSVPHLIRSEWKLGSFKIMVVQKQLTKQNQTSWNMSGQTVNMISVCWMLFQWHIWKGTFIKL